MKKTTVIWTIAPVFALLAVPFASAQTTATLYAYLDVDHNNNYQNHLVYDGHDSNNYTYYEAAAEGINGCGTTVANATTAVIGSSAPSNKFYYLNSGAKCSPSAYSHHVWLQTHMMNPNDGSEAVHHVYLGNTPEGACWASDLSTGKCLAETPGYATNMAWVQGIDRTGSWNQHTLTAYSFGTLQ